MEDKKITWLISTFGVLAVTSIFFSGMLWGQVGDNTLDIENNKNDIKQLTLNVATKDDIRDLKADIKTFLSIDNSKKTEKRRLNIIKTRKSHNCSLCGEVIPEKHDCFYAYSSVSSVSNGSLCQWKGWAHIECIDNDY